MCSSDLSGSGSIASGDRGLGLEKKYYISLSEIKTSSKSLPARLSSVGAGEGKTSNYYLYKTFVSKQKSKKNGAIRNKVAKTNAPIFKSCNFADKDGTLTGSLELDETLTSRETINTKMRATLDVATDPYIRFISPFRTDVR